MVQPYVDPASVHVPTTGAVIPAAWGTVVRNSLEALVDRPACSCSDASGQTLTTATATILNCGAESLDNDAMHSTVTNNSRITAQTAGRYLFVCTVEFAANTTGIRQVFFKKGGATVLQGFRQNATSSFNAIFQATQVIVLAVGEYIELEAYQSSGGNLNCTPREFAALLQTR